MNSKKQIMSFIKPTVLPIVILTIFPLTCIFGLAILLSATIPNYNRAKKSIAKLESSGELDKAAAELMSTNTKRFIKGKLIFTDNYIFCSKTGYVFSYNEILWTYKHKFTQTFLFIPINVTESLYVATKTMKPRAAASMGKDKMNEIKNAILEIYNHNNSCLVGYSNENASNYKLLSSK